MVQRDLRNLKCILVPNKVRLEQLIYTTITEDNANNSANSKTLLVNNYDSSVITSSFTYDKWLEKETSQDSKNFAEKFEEIKENKKNIVNKVGINNTLINNKKKIMTKKPNHLKVSIITHS